MALDNNTVLNYTDKTTIKNWFKTGLKPTQTQFWSTWDSFWHKSESLPISAISGLGTLIDGKAEIEHTHTQYATNDASSLTDDNVLSWQQKLGVDDLDYVEIPTENATENSHPYVVVINDEGKSAKRNANDFGKVDKVNNLTPDVNKNINIGLKEVLSIDNEDLSQSINVSTLKTTSNLEEDVYKNRPTSLTLGYSITGFTTIDGVKYTTDGSIIDFSDYRTGRSLMLVSDTLKYQNVTLILPTEKSGVLALTSDIKIKTINNQEPDAQGNVDISGVAMNWTNPSQRFSGLADKSADATFNRFALFDSSGNLSNSEKAITAFIKTLNSATDAEKYNWRIANRIGGESWGVVNVIITKVNILSISNASTYPISFTVTGVNFNNIKYVNLIRVKNSEGDYITEEKYNITSFSISGNNLVTIDFPPNLIPDGWIVVEVVDNLFSADRSDLIEVSSVLKPLQPLSIDWTYLGVEGRDRSFDVLTENSITFISNTNDRNTDGTKFENRCRYGTPFFITPEIISNGFEITFKQSYQSPAPNTGLVDNTPPIGIFLKNSNNENLFSLENTDPRYIRYGEAYYRINNSLFTIYAADSLNGSLSRLLKSTIKLRFSNGVVNVIIYLDDGSQFIYRKTLYNPLSAIGSCRFVIDISDRYSSGNSPLINRTIEIIDFKLM